MARAESNILKRIRLALSKMKVVTFRNNVGLFETESGEKVRTGLCVGSSDLIGWCNIKVTPGMVGSHVAIFTAIEVKSPRGRLTDAQSRFINAVRRAGGIAFVARSAEAAENVLNDQVREIKRGATSGDTEEL